VQKANRLSHASLFMFGSKLEKSSFERNFLYKVKLKAEPEENTEKGLHDERK